MVRTLEFLKRSRWAWAKLDLTVMFWLFLGFSVSKVYDSFYQPPSVVINELPTLVQINKNFIGIKIERTRNNFCYMHPVRILMSQFIINGQSLPLIVPLPTPDFMYPALGKRSFIIGVDIPSSLPRGTWFLQTVARDDCHWYSGWLVPTHIMISHPMQFVVD